MKIGIISDHRGYELKKQIIKKFKECEIVDYGTDSTKSVDYPEYAFKLGKKIVKKEVDFGIAICGSGIGMSIALNKVKGVRCARVSSIKDVIITRRDNNSNAIAFSADIKFDRVLRMLEELINTPFSTEERHTRRINMIKEYEKNN